MILTHFSILALPHCAVDAAAIEEFFFVKECEWTKLLHTEHNKIVLEFSTFPPSLSHDTRYPYEREREKRSSR